MVSLAGLIYLLLFPLQVANGYVMSSRRRRDLAMESRDETDAL